MLLGTLGVMEQVLQPVEPHLHLPVCVTYFWVHSSKPKPSPSLLQCVLLGLVYGEVCRCRSMFGGKESYLSRSGFSLYNFLVHLYDFCTFFPVQIQCRRVLLLPSFARD